MVRVWSCFRGERDVMRWSSVVDADDVGATRLFMAKLRDVVVEVA